MGLVFKHPTHQFAVAGKLAQLPAYKRNTGAGTLSFQELLEFREEFIAPCVAHVDVVGFCRIAYRRRWFLAHTAILAASWRPARTRSITPGSAFAEWTT